MKLLLLCVFSVLSVESRRYDIETETFKLYGEDLNSVLLRFRKSPEYLSILDDKISSMKAQLDQIIQQIVSYYHGLLKQRVQETFLVKVDGMRNLRRDFGSFFKQGYSYRNPSQFLRQGTTANGHPLDQYIKILRGLPTERINSFKDLGFEYAGYAIHSMIKQMGPDDTPGQSTMLPDGGDQKDHGLKTTSTTHHEHSVSPTTEVAVPADEVEQPAADTYRYSITHQSA